MNRFPRFTASLAIALGLAAMIGAASAASDQGQSAPAAQAGQGRMSRMCSDMDARMAARMAYVEVKLKLSDSQKAEFKRLSETMKTSGEAMRKQCEDKAAKAEVTALPERLARMQTMAETRTETLRKMVPAMTAFYKTLTPEQQKTADEMMPGLSGGSDGGRGHGRGHGPMMHH